MPRMRNRRGQALTEFALIVPLAILLVLGGYDTSVMGSDKVIATSGARNGARLGSELGGLGNTTAGSGTCSGAAPSTLTMSAADAQVTSTVLAATTNMTYLGEGTPHAGFPDEIDIYKPGNADGKLRKGTDPYEMYTPETSTLTTPLSSGSTYTTLQVAGGLSPLPVGTNLTLTKGSNRQTVTVSVATAANATTITVTSFVANAGYDTSSTVGATTLNFTYNHHQGPFSSGDPGNYTMDIRCQAPLGSEAEIGVRVAWTYKPANGIPGPNFVFDDGSGAGHLSSEWAVEKLMLCVENCLIK